MALRDALIREERKCIPVGICLGAIAALMNERMAGDRDASNSSQQEYSRVNTRDDDDGFGL